MRGKTTIYGSKSGGYHNDKELEMTGKTQQYRARNERNTTEKLSSKLMGYLDNIELNK